MLKINNTQFVLTPDGQGGTIVKGKFSLCVNVPLTAEHAAIPEIVEQAKDMIRAQIWDEAYADLQHVFRALDAHVRMHMADNQLLIAEDSLWPMRRLLTKPKP